MRQVRRKILVTGGAGYIGSNICCVLKKSGYYPIVLDSLVTGRQEYAIKFIHYIGDYGDPKLVKRIFKEHRDIDICIHCASLVQVPESVTDPLRYYNVNVTQSLMFYKTLIQVGCKKIVYSSTGSVYDTSSELRVNENSPIFPHSPLSRTKYINELILQDLCKAYGMSVMILRYFNPIGADPTLHFGLQDEKPQHLIGKLLEVANGHCKVFQLTGTNWETRDGTAIKDFIHVWDLALAHVLAIKNYKSSLYSTHSSTLPNFLVLNIGSGRGTTIGEFIDVFNKIVGKDIPIEYVASRPGDSAGQYANIDRAKELLSWEPRSTLEDGIRSTILWWEKRKKILHFDG